MLQFLEDSAECEPRACLLHGSWLSQLDSVMSLAESVKVKLLLRVKGGVVWNSH